MKIHMRKKNLEKQNHLFEYKEKFESKKKKNDFSGLLPFYFLGYLNHSNEFEVNLIGAKCCGALTQKFVEKE